jgi:type VI secretion system protein VasG
MVDSILTNTLLPEIGQELLTRLMEGKTAKRVHVGVKDSEFTYSFD